MKHALIVVTAALAGCNALSGVPDSTIGTLANAGGGCVKVQGLWGSGVVIVAGADKGVIRNGSVTVQGDCQGVAITETRPVVTPAPKP